MIILIVMFEARKEIITDRCTGRQNGGLIDSMYMCMCTIVHLSETYDKV